MYRSGYPRLPSLRMRLAVVVPELPAIVGRFDPLGLFGVFDVVIDEDHVGAAEVAFGGRRRVAFRWTDADGVDVCNIAEGDHFGGAQDG